MKEFAEDIDDVLKRAAIKNIRIISSGDSPGSSKENIELVREKRKTHRHLFATAGFHPYHADSFTPEIGNQYRELIKDDCVVGLGEIGLDYYRNTADSKNQRNAFRYFLGLALEKDIPFVVHNRESEEDVLQILDETGVRKFRGVIHCFSSGSIRYAQEFVKRGLHLSFAGQVTFPKAESLRKVVVSVPLNSMLIETDAPYLAPQLFRGKRNEPSYIDLTAEKIAELKGLKREDIARITLTNTHQLYRISDDDLSRPRITYRIKDSLYVNLTNRCSNTCCFCIGKKDDHVLGYNLRIEKEPEWEDIVRSAAEEEKDYNEIVFCGLGEPTFRLETLKKTAAHFKEKGMRVRLNTNGHGNLINKRNIIPEIKGLVDDVNISLNAGDEEKYNVLCCPEFGKKAFKGVLDFAAKASQCMKVTMSVVSVKEVNVEKCRKISQNLNVSFRVREEYFKNLT